METREQKLQRAFDLGWVIREGAHAKSGNLFYLINSPPCVPPLDSPIPGFTNESAPFVLATYLLGKETKEEAENLVLELFEKVYYDTSHIAEDPRFKVWNSVYGWLSGNLSEAAKTAKKGEVITVDLGQGTETKEKVH